LIELRNAIRSRRELAAIDIVRAVQTQEIRRSVATIMAMPDDLAAEVVRSDPKLLDAALAVDSACEMWGSIIYEGIADLHTVDRMCGGVVRGCWQRLRLWFADDRLRNRSPNEGEWFEWLYNMLEADPAPGKLEGAHVSYRGRTRGHGSS